LVIPLAAAAAPPFLDRLKQRKCRDARLINDKFYILPLQQSENHARRCHQAFLPLLRTEDCYMRQSPSLGLDIRQQPFAP
jgi:hypothetical protein